MITIKRTNANDKIFQELVSGLDQELKIRDGEDHSFYSQFNKINMLKYVVVAYEQDAPVGCGAIKEYTEDTMELKRMFVPKANRGKGIATKILAELENWAKELSYNKCILESGIKQTEAIGLYRKNGYRQIQNYGQYENVKGSFCFEKNLSTPNL